MTASCSDGATAHPSNPCRDGDFGLFCVLPPDGAADVGISQEAELNLGACKCTASGDADFGEFERYCEQVVSSVMERVFNKRIERDVDSARAALERAVTSLTQEPLR